MTGTLIHREPRGHLCKIPGYATPGSIWRCECGAYWKMHSIGLANAPGWYPLRGIALWRWKRRHAEDSP